MIHHEKSALCGEGLPELQNIQSSLYQLCLVEMQSDSTGLRDKKCIRRVDDWGPKRQYL